MQTIELTRGKVAVIDANCLPVVIGMKWHASGSRGRYVAQHSWRCGKTGKKSSVLMHRLIIGARAGDIVDHINGDSLDNRAKNLRIVSARENSVNRKAATGSASRFLGVSKVQGGYVAAIQTDGISIRLGRWDDEITAAAAYNRAARLIHGPCASQNPVRAFTDFEWAEVIDAKRKAIDAAERAIKLLGGSR